MDGDFEKAWQRVALLKPRLCDHIEIHRHEYRGQIWHLYQDRVTGRNHRFNGTAHLAIGLMDGRHTVTAIDASLHELLGERAPQRKDLVRMLVKLYGSDLLQTNVEPDAETLKKRVAVPRLGTLLKRFANPLAWRFRLLDPDRFLTRAMPRLAWMFRGWVAAVWAVTVLLAMVLAHAYWPELSAAVSTDALSPWNLALLFAIYPLVKLLHEFGHAFAVKRWGGEVHEMGVMLLVFVPIPYVDASSASAFPERYRRVVVSAAGIMVELFLAALGLFVWLIVEPGLVSSIALNVMLIGSVSTLLFNGNPLLRYDGYYVLSDLAGMPNLAKRANQQLGYLAQRYIFGIDDAVSPATSRGEPLWLTLYAVSSFSYRMMVLSVIVLMVIERFLVAGVMLAALVISTQIVRPMVRHVRFLLTDPRIRRRRTRALAMSSAMSLSLAALLFVMPVPHGTVSEGVIWVPENAQLRAATDGFVTAVRVESGQVVRADQPLVEIEDPLLEAQVKVLEARVRELRSQYTAHRATDRVQSRIFAEQIAAAEASLVHARERLDSLVIRSPGDGRLVIPQHRDLPGVFVHHGDLIGYIVDPDEVVARVVVSQDDVGLLRDTRGVEVRVAGRIGEPVPATMQRIVPSASTALPSAALGQRGGGSIQTDPADGSGLTALTSLFQAEIGLPASLPGIGVGQRVHVRFDHGTRPIAQQWYRSLRQLFLRHFDV